MHFYAIMIISTHRKKAKIFAHLKCTLTLFSKINWKFIMFVIEKELLELYRGYMKKQKLSIEMNL